MVTLSSVVSSRYGMACADMVALAKEVVEETRYTLLSTFQYLVLRNIFRQQRESFQAYVPIERIDSLFYCVFIRALPPVDPRVVIARGPLNQSIIALSYGKYFEFLFHFELIFGTCLHEMFLDQLL